MLSLEQIDENLSEFALAAIAAEAQSAETLGTPYPAEATCAQWAAESGYGAKVTGDNNWFGITSTAAPTWPSKMCPTHEDLTPMEFHQLPTFEIQSATARQGLGGGRYRYHLSRAFACFPSATDGVLAYIHLITAPTHRYAKAWQRYVADRDVDGLLMGIAAAGYASGAGYGQELVDIAGGKRVRDALMKARCTT